MSNEEMVIEIQTGNNGLMIQLWEDVQGLAKKYAYKLYTALEGRRGLTADDLVQTGYIALCDAVRTYKPHLAAFSTWYMVYLRKHFMEAAGFHGKSRINEPIHNASSLEQPIIAGEDLALGDTIQDQGAEDSLQSVEDRIWLEQLREVLGELLMEMPEKQADVLYRRYWQNQSVVQAGEEMGIPASSVRTNEYKGLAFLRNQRNRRRLRPFYEFDCYSGTGLGSFKRSGISVQERYLERKYG